jgi:acyl-CoA synthetase (AMP-forming)/AMP-acid ligase II
VAYLAEIDPWRDFIYRTFRDKATPLFFFPEQTLPAASVWTGLRAWVFALRELSWGLEHKLLLALPPSPSFLYVLFAALWQGVPLAILPVPDARRQEGLGDLRRDLEKTVALLRPQGVVMPKALEQDSEFASPFALVPDGDGLPVVRQGGALTQGDRRPEMAQASVLLRTSGSSGSAKWVALTRESIWSVVHSHSLELNWRNPRVLSILPWGHAFGLVIDLLLAIAADGEIVRDPYGGSRTEELLVLADRQQTTHLSAVPLVMERLASEEAGRRFLRQLQGGVVGGAPVSPSLADFLRHTKLRVGYGQTEASPGITLGRPGEWHGGFLGRAVGCRVKINNQGELCYRGGNRALGYVTEEGVQPFGQKWHPSGDLVREQGDGYVFVGRKDERIKLQNGNYISLYQWEQELQQDYPELGEVVLSLAFDTGWRLCYTGDWSKGLARVVSGDKDEDEGATLAKKWRRRFGVGEPVELRWIPADLLVQNKKGVLLRLQTADRIEQWLRRPMAYNG